MKKNTTASNHMLRLLLLGISLAVIICLCALAFILIGSVGGRYVLDAVFAEEIGFKVQREKIKTFDYIEGTPFLPLPTITITPLPTPTPTPLPIPTAFATQKSTAEWATVNGVIGYAQLYNLDCESRSAVDWAAFFGKQIDIREFISRLPKSDDPEMGFVGNINGPMGQLPPNSYGVHAAPIAKVLQDYGVPAQAEKHASFDDIKSEISAGRPVIAWIVNLPYEVDSMEYTADSTGVTSKVARFEHTWIITAFDSRTVTVVDSQWTYKVLLSTFFERWEALDNMMIRYNP